MACFRLIPRGAAGVGFVIALIFSYQTVASPITYSITQTGWSGGGEVSGIFSGEDLNHDGYLSLVDGEVSGYHITFSGNASVPTFSHSLVDLEFFRYTLGSSGFRPSFPLYSLGSGYYYDADDYSIGTPTMLGATITSQNAQVSAIPEPSMLAVLSIGSLGLGFILRRRSL